MGLELMSVTLAFTISDASPEVQTENIQWTFTDVNGTHFDISTDLNVAKFSDLTGLFSDDRLSLVFSGLNNVFEGTYTMTATNKAGNASASLILVIEGLFETLGKCSALANGSAPLPSLQVVPELSDLQ